MLRFTSAFAGIIHRKETTMLKLCDITKIYDTGGETVTALGGVSLEFRKSEFVSILGQSGCGKTTLLNIIGGLDRYTSGDLVINGTSTKDYEDRDWDVYRNHSIGFVFQNYNLIPHQTVLSNVELALTLSGVSKSERRQRATEALKTVGLGDQLKKKPNQMSGGQMQRVAIARALVNDPDILLADEPTGALDSETSVQVMELLKEVSKNRLVIMVTHNPELADRYSTRIIRLLDGRVTDDSAPYDSSLEEEPETAPLSDSEKEERAAKKASKEKRAAKKASRSRSMSFSSALSLSFNNLMTKKARTFLTSFAGSIGIIGIALILSLSTGINAYIDQMQKDTLSTAPISIQAQTADMASFFQTIAKTEEERKNRDEGKIYSNAVMQQLINSSKTTGVTTNNLKAFKEFIDNGDSNIKQYISAVRYGYSIDMDIYAKNSEGKTIRINPSTVYEQIFSSMGATSGSMMSAFTNTEIWSEMLEGKNGELVSSLIKDQYRLVGEGSRWPEKMNEVVLIVDENNEMNDVFLYSLGLKDQSELPDLLDQTFDPDTVVDAKTESWGISDLIGTKYRLILPTDFYSYNSETDTWTDMHDNEDYLSLIYPNGLELEVVGVIKPSEDAVASSLNGAVGYTSALTDYYISAVNSSEVVKAQKADPKTDILLGLPFDDGSFKEPEQAEKARLITEYFTSLSNAEKAELYAKIASTPTEEEILAMVDDEMAKYSTREAMEQMVIAVYSQSTGMDAATLKAYLSAMSDEELEKQIRDSITNQLTKKYGEEAAAGITGMTDEQKAAALDDMLTWKSEEVIAGWYDEYMPPAYSDSSLDENLSILGLIDVSDPTSIAIYADTFENKEAIADIISDYNSKVDKDDVISYTDYIALFLSGISTIIDIISYVLIAFVAISLVVSSIMIGIITYISVLERTKEIGILRSIGASKKDISRVFNAETLTVGLVAGIIGIGATLLLNIPITLIVRKLADITNITAQLPVAGAVILVIISMGLTFIAGLIPSKIAARKDPVEALRTE